MSPVLYLLLPVVISVLGSLAVVLLQRRKPGPTDSVEVFRQAMDVLAPVPRPSPLVIYVKPRRRR